jgi:signal transduction histidine kinase
MPRKLSRLRWQLTLSHLIAIAWTLVSMIVAVLFIGWAWWAHSNDPRLQPADDARSVAYGVSLLVRDAAQGDPPAIDQLNGVLGLIARGELTVVGGSASAPEQMRSHASFSPALGDTAYIAVVGPAGHVLASSDPSGSGFMPSEGAEWQPLVSAALGGTTDPSHLTVVRSGPGPAALGAFPVFGADGQPIAAIVLASRTVPAGGSDLRSALLFFGAATLVVLLGASLFALASSSVVSFFLARRVVHRLERLGRAVEAFAEGDLAQRVHDDSRDEVGELGQRFNAMADRLSASVAELAAEKQTVEATLQAKRELVANVSHELRTPLASIRGHTESLLLRQRADGDLEEYLQVIHRQTEQLSGLIDDLFLLSTTEAGALPMVCRPVVLGDVIDEVVRSIQPVALHERQVRLLKEIPQDVPTVRADRQRVAQVLSNLVRNAVRFTPEGGLVAVRACRQDERFGVVVVEDTGQGIPPDELGHVFERFYRADASRDRGSGGAGLGLAIVRELITAMGGEVWAESVPGEGSRFSFTLPLA